MNLKFDIKALTWNNDLCLIGLLKTEYLDKYQ